MRNLKKYISLALIATVAFSATGCNMIEKTEDAIRRSTVAKVNGDKITRGEVDETLTILFESLEKEYGKNYANNSDAKQILLNARQDQLQKMIMQEVIDQKSKELGINMTEEELTKKEEEFIADFKKQFESEEKFKEAMKTAKMTEDDLKKAAREKAVKERLIEEISKDVVVSDDKVKQYYNGNQEAFTEEPNKYTVSRIIVDNEENAKKVKERLDKGEEFKAVAKEVSLDKESKDKGGDMGEISYGSNKLSIAIMSVVKSLEINKISEPIQDTTGWNIIKVTGKKEYPVKKFEDVKEDIRKSLEETQKQTKVQESFGTWIKESKIKTYDNNLK